MKASNIALNTKIFALNSSVFDLKSNIQTLIDSTIDVTSGIVAGFNCLFLKNNLKRIHESICVTFMVPLFQTSLCLGILSIAFFFNSLCAYLLAMRASKFKKNEYSSVRTREMAK